MGGRSLLKPYITPCEQVSLVRGKADGKVYALKTLRKSEMLRQQDVWAGLWRGVHNHMSYQHTITSMTIVL